jgi:hypothetical protein
MQSDSSGILESIAVGLLCVVVLAAVYRKVGGEPAGQAERVAVVTQPAANPVEPVDARTEAEIKDMLLHD